VVIDSWERPAPEGLDKVMVDNQGTATILFVYRLANRVVLLFCLFSVCSGSALLITSDKILAYSLFSRVLMGSKDDSAD